MLFSAHPNIYYRTLFSLYRRPITAFSPGVKKLRKEQYMAQKNGMRRSARPMLYRRKINEIKSYCLKFHNAKYIPF